MKHYLFIFLLFTSIHAISVCEPVIKKATANINFNTIQLLGDNVSKQHMFVTLSQGNQIYPGGGLRFIQPGFDLSAIFFLDTNLKHRTIAGLEYLSMTSKEILPMSLTAYYYARHDISLFDIYLGYHYAFWCIGFQDTKVYAGPEIMFNTMPVNEYEKGIKYQNSPQNDLVQESVSKPFAFRIGGRIKLGIEGKLYENILANIGFTGGIYNLLLRDDATGELFNRQSKYDTEEAFQPFYNFSIGIQYRF